VNSFVKLALAGALIVSANAYADTLALYNTGCTNTFNNACGVLSHGTLDSHYGSTTGYVWTDAWPAQSGPWTAPSSTSAWLRPSDSANITDLPSHTYTWTQTFQLQGNPKTLNLAGRFGADNNSSIYLNGHLIAGMDPNFEFGYTTWTPFSTTDASYLVNGTNTLTFVVNNLPGNSGNPAGLRVEFSSASASVPEPSEILTSAGMLLGLGVAAFRRRRN
jgi:hypothetical protein